MTSFPLAMLCFHFVFPLSPLLLFPAPTHRSCQSLCALGRCCGCRQPALCRRPSTRQERGVRIHCSRGIDSMLCRGPPIAQICCMNMPPGRTSNRAEPPPATSESSTHSLAWSNKIWFYLVGLSVSRVGLGGGATEVVIYALGACRADADLFKHLSYVWFYITGYPTESTAPGLWCTMVRCFTTKNARGT